MSYAPFLQAATTGVPGRWQRTFVVLPPVAFAEFFAVIATAIVFWKVLGTDAGYAWVPQHRTWVRRPAGRQLPVAAEAR